MRTRAWAETLANGGRSRGRAAVRGEEEADGWDLPVSDLQREKGSSARVGRIGLRLNGPAAVAQCLFPFSFMQNHDVYLILYNKLFVDPKIMKIFVWVPENVKSVEKILNFIL